MMAPDEPHWKLFHLISGIYVKSRRTAEKWLKPLNMTWPQFGALLNLAQEDWITQRELAERLEVDTTTTMVLCDSLERKGWIDRVKDASDRRVNRLVLTEEGRSAFTAAYPLMLSGYRLYTDAISPAKIDVVLPILGELYDHIDARYRQEMNA